MAIRQVSLPTCPRLDPPSSLLTSSEKSESSPAPATSRYEANWKLPVAFAQGGSRNSVVVAAVGDLSHMHCASLRVSPYFCHKPRCRSRRSNVVIVRQSLACRPSAVQQNELFHSAATKRNLTAHLQLSSTVVSRTDIVCGVRAGDDVPEVDDPAWADSQLADGSDLLHNADALEYSLDAEGGEVGTGTESTFDIHEDRNQTGPSVEQTLFLHLEDANGIRTETGEFASTGDEASALVGPAQGVGTNGDWRESTNEFGEGIFSGTGEIVLDVGGAVLGQLIGVQLANAATMALAERGVEGRAKTQDWLSTVQPSVQPQVSESAPHQTESPASHEARRCEQDSSATPSDSNNSGREKRFDVVSSVEGLSKQEHPVGAGATGPSGRVTAGVAEGHARGDDGTNQEAPGGKSPEADGSSRKARSKGTVWKWLMMGTSMRSGRKRARSARPGTDGGTEAASEVAVARRSSTETMYGDGSGDARDANGAQDLSRAESVVGRRGMKRKRGGSGYGGLEVMSGSESGSDGEVGFGKRRSSGLRRVKEGVAKVARDVRVSTWAEMGTTVGLLVLPILFGAAIFLYVDHFFEEATKPLQLPWWRQLMGPAAGAAGAAGAAAGFAGLGLAAKGVPALALGSRLVPEMESVWRSLGGASLVTLYWRTLVFGKTLRVVEWDLLSGTELPDGCMRSIAVRQMTIAAVKTKIADVFGLDRASEVRQLALWIPSGGDFFERLTTGKEMALVPDYGFVVWSRVPAEQVAMPHRGSKGSGSRKSQPAVAPAADAPQQPAVEAAAVGAGSVGDTALLAPLEESVVILNAVAELVEASRKQKEETAHRAASIRGFPQATAEAEASTSIETLTVPGGVDGTLFPSILRMDETGSQATAPQLQSRGTRCRRVGQGSSSLQLISDSALQRDVNSGARLGIERRNTNNSCRPSEKDVGESHSFMIFGYDDCSAGHVQNELVSDTGSRTPREDVSRSESRSVERGSDATLGVGEMGQWRFDGAERKEMRGGWFIEEDGDDSCVGPGDKRLSSASSSLSVEEEDELIELAATNDATVVALFRAFYRSDPSKFLRHAAFHVRRRRESV